MTLRQQLISDRVDQLAESLNIKKDKAFERLVHSLITGKSIHSLCPTDWVDGSEDKQIDIISIDENEGDAEVFIISAKFVTTFSSNAIILTKNGLHWMLNRPRSEIESISNESFRDKIYEVRSILSNLGPSNVSIRCYFATNGDSSNISPEYKREYEGILKSYDNETFANFTFETIGADELVGMLKRVERKNRSIDADVPIRYDTNTPSLIRYHSQGLKGVICTTSARDIADLVNRDEDGGLFDSNIRRFLGRGRLVNAEILKTATDLSSSYLFWFLNNGITIVCDSCDPVADPDNPMVKIRNMQIVNGCQTATALAHAERDGNLRPDTRVLLKIFETSDPTLASRIVLTTNNQNKISTRDLKSNDAVQEDMRLGFARYGLLYEHKINQYSSSSILSGKHIVSNEDVGQAYLAFVLRKPGDARRRKYKVWTDNYSQIFCGGTVEAHVLSILLYELVTLWAKNAKRSLSTNETKRKLINNGLLHIGRIASFLWRASDTFNQGHEVLRSQIHILQKSPEDLTPHFNQALDRLDSIVDANPDFKSDVDNALKSVIFETAITRSLNGANTYVELAPMLPGI